MPSVTGLASKSDLNTRDFVVVAQVYLVVFQLSPISTIQPTLRTHSLIYYGRSTSTATESVVNEGT
jgi:hypothetical protein